MNMKKIIHIKDVKNIFLHNNNAEKLLTIWKQNYSSINNQITYPFLVLNEFIYFSEFI